MPNFLRPNAALPDPSLAGSPLPGASPAEPSLQEASPSFRVLTVNTHKGFGPLNRRFILPELRDAIRAVGADIVFLQEVHGTHRRHGSRIANWPTMAQYEFLADELWPQFAYGRNAVYPDGDHGNAVLSKFPIVRHDNRDVSLTGTEPRALLHCVVQIPGWPDAVHAICVHLGLRESHRHQQLLLLSDLVRNGIPANEAVIVAGDFNDWRRRAHALLESGAGLREVFRSADGRSARTFPARLPLLQLDRIYVRNARAYDPEVLPRRPWSHLSDHAPAGCAAVRISSCRLLHRL